MDALSSCGLHQAGEDAVGFESGVRSRSEAYFAKDHQIPERLFRMIIRGRHTGTPEESEKEFLIGACEIGSEGLGGFEAKRAFADGVEFADKAFFDLEKNMGDVGSEKNMGDVGSNATLPTPPK